MFIVNSIIRVPKQKVDEVIGLYQNRSHSVDQAPGFRSFCLLQNETDEEELTVQMLWERKEDYIQWVQSADFKRIHDLEQKYPDQELAGIKPTVKRYKVVAE